MHAQTVRPDIIYLPPRAPRTPVAPVSEATRAHIAAALSALRAAIADTRTPPAGLGVHHIALAQLERAAAALQVLS